MPDARNTITQRGLKREDGGRAGADLTSGSVLLLACLVGIHERDTPTSLSSLLPGDQEV